VLPRQPAKAVDKIALIIERRYQGQLLLFAQTKIISAAARGDVHNPGTLRLTHLIPQNDTVGFGSAQRGTREMFAEGIKSAGAL
jgi:hypothetical protein